MYSAFSIPFSLSSFGFGKSKERKPVDLPSVKIHSIEAPTDKTTKRLQSLIRLNHANHSIIFHNLQYHNHTPHILGSAYIFGANSEHLTTVYESESRDLEPWTDSPGEVSEEDWRDFLGKREYQRAYVDFFEDQMVAFGYDWNHMLEVYLFEGEHPLINSLISGLAHPLIHLAYAHELSSRTVCIEALALAACFYSQLSKYLNDPSYSFAASYTSTSPLEILRRVFEDKRFSHSPDGDINALVADKATEEAMLDHWNAWEVSDTNLEDCFKNAQKAAAMLVLATRGSGKQYDFFLLHTLTASHAVRILLPLVPARFQLLLVRQWFLFAILTYVRQRRPRINGSVLDGDLEEGRDSWKYVKHMALSSGWNTDAHYVKGLRALMSADETWGKEDGFWLKAACKLATEFDNWGGLMEEDQ